MEQKMEVRWMRVWCGCFWSVGGWWAISFGLSDFLGYGGGTVRVIDT